MPRSNLHGIGVAAGMQFEALGIQSRRTTTVSFRWRNAGGYPIRPGRRRRTRAVVVTAPETVDAAEIVVFPLTPPQSTPLPQTEFARPPGSHLTRHVGPGVEYAVTFAQVRRPRAVNWVVSAPWPT